MEREVTLLGVHHPEFIDGEWERVDHPVVGPFADGAPDLGWEGDTRLVVYLHNPSKTFVLWRYEHDGQYRPVQPLPYNLTPASVNETITNLIRTDQRRGFDAYQEVVDSQAAYDRAAANETKDRISDFADKLLYGLSRSHMPGVDVTVLRQVPSRR